MRDLEKSKRIHERAVAQAKRYLREEKHLLAIVMEVDLDRTYELFQGKNLTKYCVTELGLSEPVSETLVRVARKSLEVPELGQAVINGEVHLTKAKTIASKITPENKVEWLTMAKTLTKNKLERVIAESNKVETKPVKLDLPFETVDLLERARDLACTSQAKFVSLEETIHWALTEIIYRHDPIEKAHRSRGHSVNHEVTLRDLEQCQFIYEDGTQCKHRKWLHKHHIIPRSHGGPDTVENLITLCSDHHRYIHKFYALNSELRH